MANLGDPLSVSENQQLSKVPVDDERTSNVLGAPVEQENPLGYGVGFTSAVFLNLSQMIGVSSSSEFAF